MERSKVLRFGCLGDRRQAPIRRAESMGRVARKAPTHASRGSAKFHVPVSRASTRRFCVNLAPSAFLVLDMAEPKDQLQNLQRVDSDRCTSSRCSECHGHAVLIKLVAASIWRRVSLMSRRSFQRISVACIANVLDPTGGQAMNKIISGSRIREFYIQSAHLARGLSRRVEPSILHLRVLVFPYIVELRSLTVLVRRAASQSVDFTWQCLGCFAYTAKVHYPFEAATRVHGSLLIVCPAPPESLVGRWCAPNKPSITLHTLTSGRLGSMSWTCIFAHSSFGDIFRPVADTNEFKGEGIAPFFARISCVRMLPILTLGLDNAKTLRMSFSVAAVHLFSLLTCLSESRVLFTGVLLWMEFTMSAGPVMVQRLSAYLPANIYR
ncbi:hypothetical protein C8R47DRAFT_1199688 [Mycena vitilis]|nr:hypothetical protein C8R47DRAFT_1199688 [Mycena vitilis]